MNFFKNNFLVLLMTTLVGLAGFIAYLSYCIYSGSFIHVFPILNEATDRSNWGALGDYFGGILNPFFAFFGLIMLLATLIQSQKELSLTREEIKKSTEALQDQAQTQSRQRFEGTFFQLLSLHQETVKSIDLYNADTKHSTSGRDCFNVFYGRFKKQFNTTLYYLINPSEKTQGISIGTLKMYKLPDDKVDEFQPKIETINSAYLDFYDKNQSEIGHYFRSLYNIAKFIHTSDIENKRLYSNLLRAQLSVNEMALIFYNCLSDLGSEKFKPLIEEYALLKGIPIKLLINFSEHKKYYSKSAFGK